MNLILFDEPELRSNLLPFTFTRPVADIRIGILTIREKWERLLSTTSSSITENYLSSKFPLIIADENWLVNGAVIPSQGLMEEISKLSSGQALFHKKMLIAAKVNAAFLSKYNSIPEFEFSQNKILNDEPFMVRHSWDIFSRNGDALAADFELLTQGKKSQALSKSNQVIGESKFIFLEEGAKVECAFLNTSAGPIFIGKDAEVMEGCMVRGPFALGEHASIKMGTKIYGPTSIGPHCKVGGEVNNSVIFGYSNKAHDGFLGNSVIGEWCNLGADTNNSNLKNNYSSVKMFNYATENLDDTKLQFCGLMMGDHSKCAINTMFNTGTVVGVNANIFGSGFPAKHIPSFSWDGANEVTTYSLVQACEVAKKVFERRKIEFSEKDREILSHVFSITASHRHWERG